MDIITRLERIPVGKFHYRLLIITGLGWMFDAMDTGIIAFVLPVLIKTWGLTTAQVGYIGSVGLNWYGPWGCTWRFSSGSFWT